MVGTGEVLGLDAVMIQLNARARIRVSDPTAALGLDIIAGLGVSNINDVLVDVAEDLLQCWGQVLPALRPPPY